MAVVVYLDESGTHDDSVATVVAGYVGLQEQWLTFELQWAEILVRYGVPSAHATDMANFKRNFRDWDDSKRTAFLAELAATIKENALFGSSACLINNDYDVAFSGLTDRVQIDSKYGLCFRSCMIRIASYIRDNFPGQQVSFILEDGHKNKGDVLRLYELTKESELAKIRWPLGNLAFAAKNDCGALQAADMIAYTVYRYVCSYVKAGHQHVEPHKNLVALWEGISYHEILISRGEMEDMALHVTQLVAVRQGHAKLRRS